jgi:hypothetical protein
MQRPAACTIARPQSELLERHKAQGTFVGPDGHRFTERGWLQREQVEASTCVGFALAWGAAANARRLERHSIRKWREAVIATKLVCVHTDLTFRRPFTVPRRVTP